MFPTAIPPDIPIMPTATTTAATIVPPPTTTTTVGPPIPSPTAQPEPDTSKQTRIHDILRKSLLGEELVQTQFHLFSARSRSGSTRGSRRVLRPQVLCANNMLLAKSSRYFLDLLSSDISPADASAGTSGDAPAGDGSLVDLVDEDDVPGNARIEEYGYASDSDLEECDEPVPDPIIPDVRKQRSKSKSKSKSKDHASDGSESDSSDMFVMSPEEPDPSPGDKSKKVPGSVASSETAVHSPAGKRRSADRAAMRLRSLASRHILVRDTAFRTWYSLLYYLYTDEFDFLPLSSTTPASANTDGSAADDQPRAPLWTSAFDPPRCSAKSMYRLASKVGLDDLRYEAFTYIRRNLSAQNILQEISCSIVSTHPELREMELDVLYAHISSLPVVTGFAGLARRIANKELAHGADIIVGIHARLLQEPALTFGPAPMPASQPRPTTRMTSVKSVFPPAVEAELETGCKVDAAPSRGDKPGFGVTFVSESGAAAASPSVTIPSGPSAESQSPPPFSFFGTPAAPRNSSAKKSSPLEPSRSSRQQTSRAGKA